MNKLEADIFNILHNTEIGLQDKGNGSRDFMTKGDAEKLAHTLAIHLLQDYQKLRERVSGIDLPVKELGQIVMFIRHSMFLPENDKLSELNKMIREAIITYLQQPTEH